MCKLLNFCNLMKKKGKEKSNYVKKVDFWPNLHEICGCHGNIKLPHIQLTYSIKISATDE